MIDCHKDGTLGSLKCLWVYTMRICSFVVTGVAVVVVQGM